jgi:acetyltransferase-like isoleucine patch superfamily enzyme
MRGKYWIWNNSEFLKVAVIDGWSLVAPFIKVKVGEGSFISDGALVADGVELGKNVKVGASCELGYCTTIGNRSFLGKGVIVRACGEIRDKAGLGSGTVLEPDVFIGVGAHLGEGVYVAKGSRIGDSVTIDSNSSIGRLVVIRNRAHLGNRVTVGDGVKLGPRVRIKDDSLVSMTPLQIQGPLHLLTMVSATELQIGTLVMSVDDWECEDKREPAFKQLGLTVDEAPIFSVILTFACDFARSFGHLSFGK